jgi:4-diphosphocytidyl-2-C-methyl-D-erythritol kinase
MIRLAAPAKLNLHLRVLGLRSDGFHSIESLFVRLGLHDDVEVAHGTNGLQFEATGEFEVPRGGDNLCVAAAVSFYNEIGLEPTASIRLTKRIPVAAGLGGGSSDAASVLLGLNELLGTPLAPATLAEVGARIGSDVPFFLLQQPFALGRGRGEELSPLPPPESRPVLIVVPDFGVSAGDAYGWLREAADGSPIESGPNEMLAVTANLSDWSAIAEVSANDLAPGVFERHPSLAVTAAALAGTGAFMSLLCGSGACVAGLFDDATIRDQCLEQLQSHPAILPGWRLIPTWSEGPGE